MRRSEVGEFGRLGRSSWSSFPLEVVQDVLDEGRVDDESEEFHFFTASTTGQRIDLVATVNKLGPSFAQSPSSRGLVIALFLLLFGGVVTSERL
ncbi:MAG TPA: hypothetical protein VLK65_25455 [Vicinamibacteria bacterium]|nr:hypothetical protein [Vicinamibacteria bacterium]